jgi:predicted branched-subunit amino acid permease
MTASNPAAAAKPDWSLAGLRFGALLALPVLPGMIAFGIAVGATAARKGFSLVDSVLMNALVYGGASQMVAMEVWPDRITLASLAALALLTATVNARMLLIGASLRPWLGPLPSWQAYPMLHLSTDPGWLIAMRFPLWRGRRRAFAWGVAGAVALLTEYLVSGWWFVVTGAIAGSVAEGFADE